MKITGQIYTGPIFKGIDKIVSNDQLRPVMNHAYIDKGHIIATDGHALVKIHLSFFGIDQEGADLLEGKCIDKETLQKLGAIKAKQSFAITEQGFCLMKSNSLIPSVIYPIQLMNEVGNYPNYQTVIPTLVAEQNQTSLNANLLLSIDNVFSGSMSNEGKILQINFHGRNKAVTLTCEGIKFLGLLMPRMSD